MAINRSSIASVPLNQSTDVAIQMLATRPDTTEVLETSVQPNMLVGYYNGYTQRVELYVTNAAGNRYFRV